MMKSNAISQDFPYPVKHEDLMPASPKSLLKPIVPKMYPQNYYNNESPSLFCLDSMLENKKGYTNPFLNEVIKVDRSEEFKKMNFNRDQIKLIDKIKSRREYSQNPKILKYIRTDFDISMQNKRERNIQERNKQKEQTKFLYTESDAQSKNLYNQTINKLYYGFVPKLSYKVKRNLQLDNLTKLGKDYYCTTYDKDVNKDLVCYIDPKKSGSLNNCNDYCIGEADKFDGQRVFHFNTKPKVSYNLIKDKIEKIEAPITINNKWDSFHQNFFMLMDAERGFRKKGGLFTEFANKNSGVIEMNKRNDKEKKEIDKEYERRKNSLNSLSSINSDRSSYMRSLNVEKKNMFNENNNINTSRNLTNKYETLQNTERYRNDTRTQLNNNNFI